MRFAAGAQDRGWHLADIDSSGSACRSSRSRLRPHCHQSETASVCRNPLLQALSGVDFARIKIAARVELPGMDPVELADFAAGPAEGGDYNAILAAHGLDDIVGAVDQDEIVLHLVERREREAPGRARSQRLGVEHELLDEAAVLVEDLHAVVLAVAAIDETVVGQGDAMHRVAELR